MHRERAISDTMTMPIFRRAAKVFAIFQGEAAAPGRIRGRTRAAIKRVIFSPGGDIETLSPFRRSRRRDLARSDDKDGRRSFLRTGGKSSLPREEEARPVYSARSIERSGGRIVTTINNDNFGYPPSPDDTLAP